MWEIYSLLAWQWWVYFAWFLVAIGVSWFLPGLVILSYSKLNKLHQFYLAPVVGICLWAVQGYIFGWLNVRWASFGLLAIFGLWAIRRLPHIKPLSWKLNIPKWLVLLLICGVLLQLIPVWGSGWRTQSGISYYFVNVFDGLFHLSLARATIHHVPPFEPGAAGLPLTNYHYLSNLVMGELTRVWHIPLNHLYFQYLPTFMALWLGCLTLVLLKKWSNSNWALGFGLVLFYGVGELSWLVNLFLGSHSAVPFEVFIDHGAIQFLNPPQAFAKIVFLATLILWQHFWAAKKDWLMAILIGAMTATLVGFKVYFGLAAGAGIAAVVIVRSLEWVWQLIRQHQTLSKHSLIALWPFALMFSVMGILGAAIYLPANAGAGGLFFDFLTWPKLLLGVEKLNWNEWWLRLQVYQAAGNVRNLAIWYTLAAGIFAVAIYHLKVLGCLTFFKKLRQNITTNELLFLLTPALVFTILGTNFLQVSGGSNSFNFLVVALTILNPLTAVVMGQLAGNNWLKVGLLGLLGLTLVQTVVLEGGFIRHYVRGSDRQTISPAHEAALHYLSEQAPEQTVVQTYPGHYLDEVTPYLYFFTGHPSYWGGRGILDSHNQPVQDRKKTIQELFHVDPETAATLAHQLKITQVLLVNNLPAEHQFYLKTLPGATLSAIPHWKTSFSNEEVTIISPVEGVKLVNQP